MAGETETLAKWDGLLNELVPDAGTEAIKEAVEAGLARFERHKEALLDHLRIAYAKPEPFDADKTGNRLTRLAQAYLLRQAITPATERKAQLRKFAEALGRARDLGEHVRQDHVGSDQFSEWFDGLPRDPRGQIVPYKDEDGSLSFRVEYFPEIDFKKIVVSLGDYQAAVLRAANDVPTTSPGPAARLPRLYIRALADAYGEITGRKAGAGIGPFARFVMQFRAALDPSYRATDGNGDEWVDETVLDALKDALRKPRLTALSSQEARGRRRSAKK